MRNDIKRHDMGEFQSQEADSLAGSTEIDVPINRKLFLPDAV